MPYLGHAYITDRIAAIDGQTSYEHLVSLLKEARAVIIGRDNVLAGKWQPIETAPRDGTEVLVCNAGPNFAASIRTCWYVVDQYDGEFWQDDADSEPDPTHWQPMLPVPQSVK